eukprot:6194172-Pleurochrysis_carterae.AAC.1
MLVVTPPAQAMKARGLVFRRFHNADSAKLRISQVLLFPRVLWDTRSTVPLHELPPHNPKALCVAWDGDDRIVSGGADGHLHFFQISSA